MAQRPTRVPRWGYDPPAGALVEPDSTHAAEGFSSAERPPAQWINYLLHFALAWVDHLRGPGWGAWARESHGGTIATLATVAGLSVDTDDTRAAEQRYRWAIAGHTSAPAPKIGVSRNGLAWQDRAVPTGFTGTIAGVLAAGGVWLLWGTGASAELWTTPAHDGTSNSAIGTSDATYWTAVAEASGRRARAAAWNGGTGICVLASTGVDGDGRLLVSSDAGSSWSVVTAAWPSSWYLQPTGLAYDDTRTRYYAATGSGGIGHYAPNTGTWTNNVATLGGIASDATVHLRAGGGTLIAWASYRQDGTTALAASQLWRCEDGATWTAITLSAAMSASGGAAIITDVAYVDGVWLATTTAAPYLWRSDDDGQTWERVALPIGEEASWALHRAVYADGQVLCTGLTWTVASTRASATSPGTWTSREPGYLADAGYLRGRRIHTTAPNNGDVYAWNSGTSRWEPVAASTLSVTTTRGDLIVRGASADQRLAVGAAGRYLRSDGTDPGWSTIPSTDVTGLPWSDRIAPATAQTTDATTTTLKVFGATTDRGHALDLMVSATLADRSAQVAWKILATATNAAGVVTVRDVLITASDGGASGWTVTVDASGTDLRVRVTGAGGTTIDWCVAGTVLVHGS